MMMDARSYWKRNLEHENCASVDIDAGMARMYRADSETMVTDDDGNYDEKKNEMELSKKSPWLTDSNLYLDVRTVSAFPHVFWWDAIYFETFPPYWEIDNQSSREETCAMRAQWMDNEHNWARFDRFHLAGQHISLARNSCCCWRLLLNDGTAFQFQNPV